ncbi:hypothetical protein WME99_21120 [Sorangium sp. So ce136]
MLITWLMMAGKFEKVVTPPGRTFFPTKEAQGAGEKRLMDLFRYAEEIE